MNKFSRTARSVTFAAIVGLSLGISAPGAFAQENQPTDVLLKSADSLINPETSAKLTIHKFGDPTAEKLQDPTGTEEDAQRDGLGEKLDGVTFTIYKINKDLDGKPIDMKTNAGLAAAAKIFNKAGDYAGKIEELTKSGVLSEGKAQETENGGVATFEIGTEHAPYLVVETGPKDGYTPANPFIAFVPMTKPNEGQGGTEWNYDVHAVPKNYKKPEPKKTVVDINEDGSLDQAGSEIEYNIDTTVRKIDEGKRLKYYFIGDTLDKNNFDVSAESTKITVSSADATAEAPKYEELSRGVDYTVSIDKNTNAFRVNFTKEGLKKLGSGEHVRVNVKAVKNSDNPIAPNEATEWEPKNPTSDQDLEGGEEPPANPEPDSGRKTKVVETRSGELTFTKVDKDEKGLEGAEFQIWQTAPGQTCDAVDVKNPEKNAFQVSAQDGATLNEEGKATSEFENTFKSNKEGVVKVTGLHVNDFVNNAEVQEGERTSYCLIETKAPKGKELLSKAVPFQLLKSEETKKVTVPAEVETWEKSAEGEVTVTKSKEATTIDSPVYKPVSVTVGDFDGKVVNLDDTTPQLPLTGGAGVGILAAIGAAIVAVGAWFARRGAKN